MAHDYIWPEEMVKRYGQVCSETLQGQHQIDGVKWMLSIEVGLDQGRLTGRGGILADDMGLGKTFQAMAVQFCSPSPTLVVVPKSLMSSWCEVSKKVTGHFSCILAGADACSVLGDLMPMTTVAVTSYPTLVSHLSRKTPCPAGVRCMMSRVWGRIVLDEGHIIRNSSSKTSKAAFRLHALRKWVLTATPINNLTTDLDTLCAWIQVPRSSLPERQLRRTIHAPSVAKLPPLQSDSVYLDFKYAEERESYADALANYKNIMQRTCGECTNPGNAILGALQKCQQACVHPRLACNTSTAEHSTKFDFIIDMLLSQDPPRKAVIFCEWILEMELLRDFLQVGGVSPVFVFNGALQTFERKTILSDFEKCDEPSACLLVQIRAGGVGLNLQSASIVVITTPSWNPAVELQALGRAYRTGQSTDVKFVRIYIRDSVECNRFSAQKRKIKLLEDCLGGAAGDIGSRLGFVESPTTSDVDQV